ncbi:MAG: tetratricopeptide repeat protein [Candidatus Gastranaerophilales bacterium]|nr:tetratricopeptide repeat protein [Candidatus Gastranaerophilales bacterium]
MKKVIGLFICILLIQNAAVAQTVYDDSYEENPNYIQGNKYLQSSQYSSAINEFKKAIRVNSNDISALIGLSNAYNLRAVYYNNTVKDTAKAISDLKSALFFVKYYAGDTAGAISASSVDAIRKNLSTLETSSKQNITAEGRISTAKSARIKGEFAAAAYDYYQIINDSTYKAQANSGLGDIYKIFNRPEKAISFYKEALRINPDDNDVHLKLARTYEQVNDFNSSLNEYSYALDSSNDKEDILSSLERIWQKKVDESPKDAEAHANLGVIYQKEKRYQEAMKEYMQAEQLNPANINTKINIGTLYQEQKKYDSALNTYNSILQSQPKNTKVLVYKAECLKALKKNEEAVAIYKTALNLEPSDSSIKAALFELLKDTMSTDDVLDFLYKNVQNSPMDADSYYELAYELHKAGKLDDAIVYYNQTIKLNKKKIDAYINLSQVYRQKNNYQEAYNIINTAKSIAPDNELVKKQFDITAADFSASNYNTASNALQSGDYQKAITEYSKINPPTVDSLIGIAAAYQYLGNNINAIENYKKAMELDSKNADIPFYIASLYANSGDDEKARQYLEIALSKNPSNSQAKELSDYLAQKQAADYLTQAVNMYDSGKYKESIPLFDKIINLSPDNGNAYYYRALAYDGINSYQKAISDYKSALKYSPDMIIAYYSLGVDYDAIENYQSAKENYRKFVELYNSDDDFKAYAKQRIEEIK